MKKAVSILVLSILNLIYSLASFIDSFSLTKYENNGGFDVDFNSNYLIWFISSIILGYYAILLFKEEKNTKK